MAMLDSVYSVVQIAPTGVETFVRLSQNENGRTLTFAIVGGTIPSGSTVTISGTKPDGVVFSASGSMSGNTATFTESIQLTAVAGIWPAKLKVVNSGRTIATGRIRFVIDADTVAAGAVPSDSELEGLVAEAAAYAEAAKDGAYYGSPLKAATVAEMTDKNRVYVYTGSESGYTNGDWYYWNGSAWTSGGVYNSVAVDTDKTLNVSGKAADAKVTGDAIRANAAGVAKNTDDINELKADLEQIVPGLSEEAKEALLACFEHVAWIDEHGQDYYDDLESALYPDTGLVSISAVFTQGSAVIYPSTPLNDLKAYLVVTGYYNDGTSKTITDYALSGTLTEGTSTITVTVDGKTATFNVVVTAPYWDYEWDASSESMPTDLTYFTAEFITRNDEKLLKVTNPNLDFNYVGDCELEIVGKWEIFNPAGTYWNGEPQLIVVADDHGADGKDGFKTYCLKIQNDNSVFTNASGSNQATQIDGVSALRTYNLKFENGSATLKVDDNVIASGTGVHNNNYLSFTGIYSEYESESAGMVIKAIKFKQL